METEFFLRLGNTIRRFREEKKISLDELSKRSKISSRFLIQIEKGKANPSIRTLYSIALSLDTTINFLFHADFEKVRQTVRESQTSYSIPENDKNLISAISNMNEKNRKKALAIIKILCDS